MVFSLSSLSTLPQRMNSIQKPAVSQRDWVQVCQCAPQSSAFASQSGCKLQCSGPSHNVPGHPGFSAFHPEGFLDQDHGSGISQTAVGALIWELSSQETKKISFFFLLGSQTTCPILGSNSPHKLQLHTWCKEKSFEQYNQHGSGYLVQVNVVGLQSLEAGLHGLHDVLATQTKGIRLRCKGIHGIVRAYSALGRNHHVISVSVPENKETFSAVILSKDVLTKPCSRSVPKGIPVTHNAQTNGIFHLYFFPTEKQKTIFCKGQTFSSNHQRFPPHHQVHRHLRCPRSCLRVLEICRVWRDSASRLQPRFAKTTTDRVSKAPACQKLW